MWSALSTHGKFYVYITPWSRYGLQKHKSFIQDEKKLDLFVRNVFDPDVLVIIIYLVGKKMFSITPCLYLNLAVCQTEHNSPYCKYRLQHLFTLIYLTFLLTFFMLGFLKPVLFCSLLTYIPCTHSSMRNYKCLGPHYVFDINRK